MELNPRILGNAADTLRAWALDEELKSRVMANPHLAQQAERIARRYTAGYTTTEAIAVLAANAARGHRGSIERVGESVRDATVANRETDQFIELIHSLAKCGLQATISFDLSHVGSVVSPELGLTNVMRIAQAAREANTSVMISAEGSDRTDLVLDLYEQVAATFPETGVTLQARLHRSGKDLSRVTRLPGPVRVVKGAFLEPESVAYPRDSNHMITAYRAMVAELVGSGHRVNIATHDAKLVHSLRDDLSDDLRGQHVEFETLQGLGTELLDSLRFDGYATREYVVYGPEWWLYVLNRIAELPERVLIALADLSTE